MYAVFANAINDQIPIMSTQANIVNAITSHAIILMGNCVVVLKKVFVNVVIVFASQVGLDPNANVVHHRKNVKRTVERFVPAMANVNVANVCVIRVRAAIQGNTVIDAQLAQVAVTNLRTVYNAKSIKLVQWAINLISVPKTAVIQSSDKNLFL